MAGDGREVKLALIRDVTSCGVLLISDVGKMVEKSARRIDG